MSLEFINKRIAQEDIKHQYIYLRLYINLCEVIDVCRLIKYNQCYGVCFVILII
jgi:hypothetical protein